MKPTKLEIATYWLRSHEGRSRFPDNKANRDFEEPCCFGCGYDHEKWRDWDKTDLQIAHLQPRSLGGSDAVENLVLLCKRCHDESPDYHDTTAMIGWLSQRKMRLVSDWEADEFLSRMAEGMKNAGTHFGRGYKPSTIALLMRDAMSDSHGHQQASDASIF